MATGSNVDPFHRLLERILCLTSAICGSSSEGLAIARTIQDQLVQDAEITLWSDSLFDLGKATLESLLEFTQRFDFAVLVLTRDDKVTVKGEETPVARDHVIFEFGLFMGRLGRENVCGV